MPATTPSERAMVARIASAERWSRCSDTTAATEPARQAFNARFARQVDPDGTLPPAERARRAGHARRAWFQRLALKSAQSRRRARELTEVADVAEAELRSLGGGDDAA